jgi:hypothetical protein
LLKIFVPSDWKPPRANAKLRDLELSLEKEVRILS